MQGWIKLHRKFTEWEWYTSTKHVRVFLDLILNANHKDKKYRGSTIRAGQLTTSYQAISDRTGVSIRSIRTVLKDLKTTHEVTCENMRHYSLITILKWDIYQGRDTPDDNLVTSKRQPNDNLMTTNKNEKNEKNGKNNIYSRVSPENVEAIVTYLNKKVGSKYRHKAQKTISLLSARFSDGFEIEDFKRVIDTKSQEWLSTDMEKFLRPETLFGTKFESYLNQKIENNEIKQKRLREQML